MKRQLRGLLQLLSQRNPPRAPASCPRRTITALASSYCQPFESHLTPLSTSFSCPLLSARTVMSHHPDHETTRRSAHPAAVDTIHPSLPHRLPPNAVPSHYELHITPNLTTFVFQANVQIHLKIVQATKTIRLNTAEIKVKSATLSRSSSDSRPVSLTATFEEEDEVCVLTAGEELAVGEGVLTIEYEGEHNDKMRGCYRSKYTTPSGEERWMITTQFEATDARRAMPCWDEPAYKATFTLHLTTSPHLTAVSNMPITESKPAADGLVTHSFDKSPVMSSYLYAWVVGEFDKIEDKTSDGTVVRVFTPVGKSEQGRFALECAMRILPFYNKFFKHQYPLPKLDMLAIADFAAGAMENWYSQQHYHTMSRILSLVIVECNETC